MGQLILLRHGKSKWNKKNIFTGWVDIPLADEGIDEAKKARDKLASHAIDAIYCSTLVRAMMTVMIAMVDHPSGRVPCVVHKEHEEHNQWYDFPQGVDLVPVYTSWHLNERMYGTLQGKNKDEMREKYGPEQVKMWRRSFSTPPPEGESLELTAKRTLPYFDKEIAPRVSKGETILVSAHGNSIRSIVMELENLSEEEVLSLEIPTGDPLFYSWEGNKFQKNH
jgi:2,3-bisphosphoglycerate-dependent phosphoglycerate mutase